MARIKKPLEIDLDLVGSGLTHARGHLQVSEVSLARDVHCPAGSAVGPLQEPACHGEHLDESPRPSKLVASWEALRCRPATRTGPRRRSRAKRIVQGTQLPGGIVAGKPSLSPRPYNQMQGSCGGALKPPGAAPMKSANTGERR